MMTALPGAEVASSWLATLGPMIDENTEEAISAAVAPVQAELDSANAEIEALQSELYDAQAQLEASEHVTLFGAFPGPDTQPSSASKAQMRATVCARFGVAQLPVERFFTTAGSLWTLPPDGNAVYSVPLSATQLGSLAAGDATLTAGLDSVLSFMRDHPNNRYYFTVTHEPDNGKATGAQLVPALQYVKARRDALGAHNVKVGPLLMSWTLISGGNWQQYCFSGMEFLGFDAYLRPNGPATSPELFKPLIEAAKAKGVPLVIGEFSLGPVGNGGTGFTDEQWTQALVEAVTLLDVPEVDAVCFFETNKSDGDWRLANHPSALGVYRQKVYACS